MNGLLNIAKRLEEAGLAIAPLEWRQETSAREDGPREPTGDWSVSTSFGDYCVVIDEGAVEEGGADWMWCAWTPVESLGHFGDLDEAKAALQAHHDTIIIRALRSIALSDLDEDTRLKLIGLKAIAIDLNKQMKTVHGVVGRLVGADGDDMDGWLADFCYDDSITVEQLWERTRPKAAE